MKEEIIKYIKKVEAINECLMDYSSPIFITGNIYDLESLEAITISAKLPKEEMIIINEKYPSWFNEILNRSNDNNILIIKDFDKIELEKQKLFIDIIAKNCFSSINLPNNLKIIINAEEKCIIIPEINDVIQYFEM